MRLLIDRLLRHELGRTSGAPDGPDSLSPRPVIGVAVRRRAGVAPGGGRSGASSAPGPSASVYRRARAGRIMPTGGCLAYRPLPASGRAALSGRSGLAETAGGGGQ